MQRIAVSAALLATSLAGPAALSGCMGAGDAQVMPARVESRYSASEVNAVGPAMPVEVHGAPPDGGTPEAVAAAMRMPNYFSVRKMELVPHGFRGPRIVLSFGGGTAGERLCRTPSGSKQGAGDQLRVAMAYCYDDRLGSETVMRSRSVLGPGDPRFGNAMSYATIELLPPSNPDIDVDGARRWF